MDLILLEKSEFKNIASSDEPTEYVEELCSKLKLRQGDMDLLIVLCVASSEKFRGKKQVLVMGYEVDRVHKMPTMVYEVQAKRRHSPSSLSCRDKHAEQRDYVRRVRISGSRVWMRKEHQYLHCCCCFVSIPLSRVKVSFILEYLDLSAFHFLNFSRC